MNELLCFEGLLLAHCDEATETDLGVGWCADSLVIDENLWLDKRSRIQHQSTATKTLAKELKM